MNFSSAMDGPHFDFYKAMLDTIQDDLYCLTTKEFCCERISKYLSQGLNKLITKNAARGTIGQCRLEAHYFPLHFIQDHF